MPGILRYLHVFHQGLPFHARAALDHAEVTNVCRAESGYYWCSKTHLFDARDHDHRKILIVKHANIFWYIVMIGRAVTNSFHVYIFSWWNAVWQRANYQMSPRADCQNVVRLFSCTADANWVNALSCVDGVPTGYFSFSPTESIAIAFLNSGLTCVMLFFSCFASLYHLWAVIHLLELW